MITNTEAGTNIAEIAEGIYRINTPVPPPVIPGGFSFNQYLILDDEPLLFHTGPRRMFDLVSEAIQKVMDIQKLRYVGLSHFEADECGSLNDFLHAAPNAQPLCGRIAAMTSINDMADRAPKVLADDEQLSLGKHTIRWFDTPHMPHGWECGLMLEEATRTFLCGDLFTQPGPGAVPLVETDIWGPSEALRQKLDYYSHSAASGQILKRLAEHDPASLACMHGSAWHGDVPKLLLQLAAAIG
jgi:flavorubredoxin